MIQLSFLETSWGVFAYGVRDTRLVASFLPDSKALADRRLRSRFPDAVWCDDLLPEFRDEVIRYFAGEPVEFSLETDLSDCAVFHQRVLRACRKVAFGATITYGELARKIGHPNAARAVGQAMAANPVPLVVPCHRVVAANGRLGGFSSPTGSREKLRLLRHENPMYEPASGSTRSRKASEREVLLTMEVR